MNRTTKFLCALSQYPFVITSSTTYPRYTRTGWTGNRRRLTHDVTAQIVPEIHINRAHRTEPFTHGGGATKNAYQQHTHSNEKKKKWVFGSSQNAKLLPFFFIHEEAACVPFAYTSTSRTGCCFSSSLRQSSMVLYAQFSYIFLDNDYRVRRRRVFIFRVLRVAFYRWDVREETLAGRHMMPSKTE